MRQSTKSLIALTLGAAVIAALVWTIVRDRASQPYSVPRGTLTGWTLITSQGADAWVIAAQPPPALAAALFKQISAKTGLSLVAPEHAVLPLVMRSEYDDALQGVYGVDFLIRTAHEVGIETAMFEPVCVARATDRRSPGVALFFVAFAAQEFRDLRDGLLPAQPEHGGVGVYDPTALTPILPVAGSRSAGPGLFWPDAFDRRSDCVAPLLAN